MKPLNRPCPMCKSCGHDSDGNHLFLMEDGKTWGCNKNGVYHASYFERETVDLELLMQKIPMAGTASQKALPSMEQIANLGVDAIRGVPLDIVAFYGVKIEFDQTTREQLTHYYPITSKRKLVSYHVRKLPKDFFHLHKRSEIPDHIDLFGMNTMNIVPQHLIIYEGEIDCMSGFVMLSGHKKVSKLRALSLPTGNNLNAIQQNIEMLRRVPNLYFSPDQDDAGRKLIPEIWRMLPNIKIIEHTEKDADEMFKLGKIHEYHEAFRRAETYKPATIVSTSQLKVKAMTPVTAGLSYPFPSLTKQTYGLKTPRLIGIGAGPGTGKTVFTQSLLMHIAFVHKMPSAIFSLEEEPADSLRRMAGHIMGLPLHLPNVVYDPFVLEQVIDSLAGKLFYYDHSGYRDWQDVEEVIRFLSFEGVKFFFIDPISALHTNLASSETNQFLNKAMFQMSRMIHELNICIFHINHLNNPTTGKDHNEGGKAKASQFTGSRSGWRFSTDIWTLTRDAQNPDPAISNVTTFNIDKNRLAGLLGSFPIKYNHSTGRLEEMPLSISF
jgi:twinkle protein